MKKFIFPGLICITLFSLHACKKVEKDPLDYYPKVKTVSASLLADGRVQVTGEILDPGAEEIKHVGFCMAEETQPDMLSNQQMAVINGNTFRYIYDGLNYPKEYFFQAWAVNEYGYARGNVLSLDSIKGIAVAPPCTVTLNTIYSGLSSTQTVVDVTYGVLSNDNWEVNVSTNNWDYHFYLTFDSPPVTGVYTTTGTSDVGPNQVQIYIGIDWSVNGYGGGFIEDGALLYVDEIADDEWIMTLCSSPWTYSYNSQTYNMKARFKCPL